jgi:hypothetical protein
VEPKDILLSDMGLGESIGYVRHLWVVDHPAKTIALLFRGRKALWSALLDVLAFSKELCGGQANSGMAQVARNTWKHVEGHASNLMKKFPDY